MDETLTNLVSLNETNTNLKYKTDLRNNFQKTSQQIHPTAKLDKFVSFLLRDLKGAVLFTCLV